MEHRITELMRDYGDSEFAPEDKLGLSAGRIRKRAMEKLGLAPARPRRRLGRTLLLTACFALILSAGALAAYQYGLKDAMVTDGLPALLGIERANVLSMMGYQDSPEYQAWVEWETYYTEYTNGLELDDTVPDVEAQYLPYGVYDEEMAEKLEEIAAKYGLTLHDGVAVPFDTAAQAYALLGTEPFLSGEQYAVTGYAYSDGTFKMENTLVLDEAPLYYTIFNSINGTITAIFGGGIDGEYEEWSYVTASGVTVDLALGEDKALILADGEDDHVTVSIDAGTSAGTYPDRAVSREDVEAVADCIDFAVIAGIGSHGDEEYQAYLAQKEADDAANVSLAEAIEALGYDGDFTADILEGYELTTNSGLVPRFAEDDWQAHVIRIYETADGESQLVLRYWQMSGAELERDVDESCERAEDTGLLGVDAYFIIRDNGNAGGLVWRDEEKGLDFMIWSKNAITQEEMVRQAQRLLADNG